MTNRVPMRFKYVAKVLGNTLYTFISNCDDLFGALPISIGGARKSATHRDGIRLSTLLRSLYRYDTKRLLRTSRLVPC